MNFNILNWSLFSPFNFIFLFLLSFPSLKFLLLRVGFSLFTFPDSFSALSTPFCGSRRRLEGGSIGLGERGPLAAPVLCLRLTLPLVVWPSLVWATPFWKHFSPFKSKVVLVSCFSAVFLGSLNSPHSFVNWPFFKLLSVKPFGNSINFMMR